MPDRPASKDVRREAAREKARQMRQEQAQRQRRSRVLILSAVVVAAVLAVGAVSFAITRAGDDAPQATPPGVSEAGGIVTGQADAPHSVTIYQDYQCPACKAWEESVGPWLLSQRDAGVTSVEYRPIAILNRFSSGTEYSTRSASAAFCVAGEPGVDFDSFNQAMYAAQPAEGGTGLTDDELVSIAGSAGATGANSCITGGSYGDYADDRTREAVAGDANSTPTILVDGEPLQSDGGYPPTQQQLASALDVTS